jgi:hypothetical protein
MNRKPAMLIMMVMFVIFTVQGALAIDQMQSLGNSTIGGQIGPQISVSYGAGYGTNNQIDAFKFNTLGPYNLSTIQFYVYRTGNFSQNYSTGNLSIRSDNAGSPGAIVGTNIFYNISPTPGTYVNITGLNAILNSNSKYWIVFNATNNTAGTNYFQIVGGGTQSTNANTSIHKYYNTSGSWVDTTSYDNWVSIGSGTNYDSSINIKTFGSPILNLTIVDETTGVTVKGTTNSTVSLLGTANQYSYSINGTATIYGLNSDIYQMIVTSPGYFSRSYTVNMQNGGASFTAFVLNSTPLTNIQTTFTITDYTNIPLEGTLVTSQVLTNTTFTTIETRTADFAGQAKMSFDSTKFYTLTFSKTGYATKTATLQPIQTGYNVRLDKNSGVSFLASFNDITSVGFTPANITLIPGVYNFTFSVGSINSSLNYYGMSDNYGNSTNVTLNPSGGTTSLNINLTGFEGTYQINYIVGTVNNGIWTYSQLYNVRSYFNTSTNATVGFTVPKFGDSLGKGYVCTPFGEVCHGGAILIAVGGIVVVLLILGSMMFGTYLGAVAGILIILSASIGFIPWTYAIITSAILFVAAFIGRR